ncbi:MAG: hypothetical protein ACE3JK_14520 [Sporolactobacillus sp.]
MLKLRPLNLQFFAEDSAPEGQTEEKPVEEKPATETEKTVEQPKVQETEKAEAEAPKVDIEGLTKKAQAAILKQLGVSDVKTAKANLKAYQEHLESQKSEAEKQADKLAQYEKSLQEKDAAIAHANAKVSALSKGVKADAVDDVIKLVGDSEDVEKALENILTKYPQFKQETTQQDEDKPKPSFGDKNYKPPKKAADKEKWANAFNFLKNRESDK